MATPSNNAVPITYFNSTNFGYVTSMIHGTKWGGAVGSGATLTYSFPSYASWWEIYYGGDYYSGDPWYGFGEFNASHQAAANGALAAWANISKVSFKQTTDTETNVGEIRFAFTDNMSAREIAHAYYPNETVWGLDLSAESGDVWINQAYYGADYSKGSLMYTALLHEVGHSLGLNHSFDLPDSSYDNWFFTVMSYTASPWTSDQQSTFHPTTPMYYDIVAIQAIYGVDKTTNTGNTTYRYTDGLYWETIYDAGGKDTIAYDGSANCEISLAIGTWSALGDPIYFSGGISTRYSVCIGPSTVIENAIGGNLGDTLIGNSVANTLDGRGGDDLLSGGLGRDTLTGGAEGDQFLFDVAVTAANGDKIIDMTHDVDLILLDDWFFTAIGPTLDAGEFASGSKALDADDRIIYNSKTGALSYDFDGIGKGRAVTFATLTNKPLLLDNEDFSIV